MIHHLGFLSSFDFQTLMSVSYGFHLGPKPIAYVLYETVM